MKHQIFVIHGGDTFDSYAEYIKFLKKWRIDFEEYRSGKSGWKKGLGKKLGTEFEVISPNMPSGINAKYLEWAIWFKKFVPYFQKDVVFIGHSLGGIFLAKYFSENKINKKIKAVFLVGAPYDDKDSDDTLADFVLPKSLKRFESQVGRIYIYNSKDDPYVSFANFAKYRNALKSSIGRIFVDRGHFLQEELPELVLDIKSLF